MTGLSKKLINEKFPDKSNFPAIYSNCILSGIRIAFCLRRLSNRRHPGHKNQDESVTISFQRKHYWGFIKVNETIENVQKVTLKSSLIHRSQPRRLRSVSGVFLENETEAVRLLAGSSDVNDNLKWDAVQSIKDFINDPQQKEFQKTIRLTNLFGWFGLPFMLLGLLGLVGWPAAIIRYIKQKNQ